jgi:hypothetical protein
MTLAPPLDRDERVTAAKRAGVTDAMVARALAAYEEMPAWTGREDRMRVAIAAVVRTRDAKLDGDTAA